MSKITQWSKSVEADQFVSANHRLRKEYLIYSMKDGKLTGYFIKSMDTGVVFDEAVDVFIGMNIKATSDNIADFA